MKLIYYIFGIVLMILFFIETVNENIPLQIMFGVLIIQNTLKFLHEKEVK